MDRPRKGTPQNDLGARGRSARDTGRPDEIVESDEILASDEICREPNPENGLIDVHRPHAPANNPANHHARGDSTDQAPEQASDKAPSSDDDENRSDASSVPRDWKQRLVEIEFDDRDPAHTLIFHRFDPNAPGPRGPHFDTEEDNGGDPGSQSEKTLSGSSPSDDLLPDDLLPDDSLPDRFRAVVPDEEENASGDAGNRLFTPARDSLRPLASPADNSASNDSLSRNSTYDDRKYDEAPVFDALPLTEPEIDVYKRPAQQVRHYRHHHPRRSDPLRNSMVMLCTVFAMLAAARFVLPGIVEELRYAQHRGQLRAEFEVAGQGLKDVSLDTLSRAYQMVSAKAGPSVVHIDIRQRFSQPAPRNEVPGAPSILVSDQGSGVVVDAEGYILTNSHVVASSDEISVTLSDGRSLPAIVLGTDEDTDLAVLKVDADNLLPIAWGDSERIRVGSPVWAIGSPFGLDRTVTFGILSGKHRVVQAKDRYQDFMQSDVAVNPGNSGGPLVDSRGTLIGINTAIVGDTYQGVSFAIPSNIAKKIYERLKESGSIQRGWLGVQLGEVPDDLLHDNDHRLRGAMILKLADQTSGAARAGLRPGDVVLKFDDQRIRDVDHLMQLIGNAMASTVIKLSVIRDDREMNFDVMLGLRPDQPKRP